MVNTHCEGNPPMLDAISWGEGSDPPSTQRQLIRVRAIGQAHQGARERACATPRQQRSHPRRGTDGQYSNRGENSHGGNSP